jgi:hypothetical protein
MICFQPTTLPLCLSSALFYLTIIAAVSYSVVSMVTVVRQAGGTSIANWWVASGSCTHHTFRDDIIMTVMVVVRGVGRRWNSSQLAVWVSTHVIVTLIGRYRCCVDSCLVCDSCLLLPSLLGCVVVTSHRVTGGVPAFLCGYWSRPGLFMMIEILCGNFAGRRLARRVPRIIAVLLRRLIVVIAGDCCLRPAATIFTCLMILVLLLVRVVSGSGCFSGAPCFGGRLRDYIGRSVLVWE